MLMNRATNQRILADLLFSAGCVTTTVPLFVSFEVRTVDTLGLDRFLAAGRRRALVAVLRMVAVIHVAAEVG
jgi:hypothetical protein